MKSLPLLLAICLFSFSSKADQIVAGYMITNSNDTIRCSLKVTNQIKNYSPYYKVTIVDTAGNETTHKAKRKEIKGFGCVVDGVAYDYLSLPEEDENEPPFAFRSAAGKRLTLYTYTEIVSGYHYSSSITHYILVNGKGEKLSVSNDVLRRFKPKLRDYFKNDAELLQLMESSVGRGPDLLSFVEHANPM